MNKWDAFKQPSKQQDMQKVEVEGNFMCQVCNESCDNAFYLPSMSVLTWKCSSGHISTIEEFHV
jgi:hypothetical protein